MKRLTSIVAMNHDGAIGAANGLPWRLRTDLQFFKEQTLNSVVIMGRRTYDSLGARPLPNRMNIVLSHSFGLIAPADNCKAAFSLAEGLWLADRECGSRECFVIGGASIYTQFAPYVDRYLITLVDKDVNEADAFVEEQLFQDQEQWEIDLICSKRADGIKDEADFSIFELISSRAGAIAEQRNEAITAYKQPAPAASRKRVAPARQPGAASQVYANALI